MKKIAIALMLSAFLFQGFGAEEFAPAINSESKAIQDQIKTSRDELNKMRCALMKEMKDDANYKALLEKKKAVEKELDEYLKAKKPEMAEIEKKIEGLNKQLCEARKAEKEKAKAAQPATGPKKAE